MSGKVPSIKGAIFAIAVQDIRGLLKNGELSRDDVASALAPGEVDYLDESIQASCWYDVATYGRLLELLKKVVGEGRNEYLCQRGERSAEILRKSGRYQQMDYLERTQAAKVKTSEERFKAFGRDLRLFTSLQMCNFTSQTPKPDPDHERRWMVEISEAEPYPEALCWTTQGFYNGMSRRPGRPDLWYWERPTPDVILYRMTRSL